MNSNQISLAGEFAVLSQLSLRGYDANMTLGNTKGVDILVSNPKNGKMYRVEVKTNYRDIKNKPSKSKIHGKIWSNWIMNKFHETIIDPELFYCFVNICKKTNIFKFYIVPSRIVAKYVKDQHKLWLKLKRKENKKIKDTSMRLFRIGLKNEKYLINTPTTEKYENNWNFLNN
jgi:hypothetical protein